MNSAEIKRAGLNEYDDYSSGTQREDLLLSVVLKHLQITGTEGDPTKTTSD